MLQNRPRTYYIPSPPRTILLIAMTLFLMMIGVGHGRSAAAAAAPTSFADLAEQLSPTVVNIYTTQTIKTPSSPHRFQFPEMDQLPEPFRRFFGQPFAPNAAPQRQLKRTSLGSGVITSADGFILTNNHMVEDADSISVILSTYEEYQGTIIGRDDKSDLALIKIEPEKPLPFVKFGDSDGLRVGDWVLAIGNPFGLEQTVTAGIVSAKSRSISNETYGNFIQTDASINPGNSGGPLFDLNGMMVGINTAIYSKSGGNIGIGFAIPINMAKNIMEQLKQNGTVIRGWLGVLIQHVSPDLANTFGLKRPIGALVGQVTPDSPAERGGIKQGDVIVSYQGKEITQMSMLPAMVAQTPVGEKAGIEVIRNGKKKKLNVTIAKMEGDEAGSEGTQPTKEDQALGLAVQELSPELAKSLHLEITEGLIITDVSTNTPAAEAGLKRGDLIMEVNRQPVTSMRQYREAIDNAKQQGPILLLVKRDDHSRFVVLRVK